MTTSAVPYLIDELVTKATASAALGANITVPVTIFDGPFVSNDWPQNALWIGVDPNFLNGGATATSAMSSQKWVGPGNRVREEMLTIHCAADAWNGSTDMRSARQQAYAIMSAFEAMTRLDANAGGTVLFTDPGVTNAVLLQGQTKAGARATVTFDFTCLARIGA